MQQHQLWSDAGPDGLTLPKLLKVSGASSKFRTETCEDRFSLLNGNGLSESERAMLDMVQIQKPSAKPRVACLVYSFDGNRQKQRDSYATWGQDCDEFLVSSNEEWEDTDSGFKTIEVHPVSGDENDLAGKLR